MRQYQHSLDFAMMLLPYHVSNSDLGLTQDPDNVTGNACHERQSLVQSLTLGLVRPWVRLDIPLSTILRRAGKPAVPSTSIAFICERGVANQTSRNTRLVL